MSDHVRRWLEHWSRTTAHQSCAAAVDEHWPEIEEMLDAFAADARRHDMLAARDEQARAVKAEATRQERERCARLAELAQMPGLAAQIRRGE